MITKLLTCIEVAILFILIIVSLIIGSHFTHIVSEGVQIYLKILLLISTQPLRYKLIQLMLKPINIVLELKKTNQATGKSRAGLTTKIHAITDGNGHAINFAITQGNAHDITQAENLISSAIHKEVSVLADRAYDCNKIIEYIGSESADAVIPTRKNRKTDRDYDKEVYKNRNQI